MRMLVTPERIVHTIPDRAALADLVQSHKLGWKLHGNLRQLLGFDKVGAGRQQRREADGTGIENMYYRFEDVTWFYHADVSTALPLSSPPAPSAAAPQGWRWEQQHPFERPTARALTRARSIVACADYVCYVDRLGHHLALLGGLCCRRSDLSRTQPEACNLCTCVADVRPCARLTEP